MQNNDSKHARMAELTRTQAEIAKLKAETARIEAQARLVPYVAVAKGLLIAAIVFGLVWLLAG